MRGRCCWTRAWSVASRTAARGHERPHKYASPAAQAAQLPARLEWVRGYYTRVDDLSQGAHRALFASLVGTKIEIAQPASPDDALFRALSFGDASEGSAR